MFVLVRAKAQNMATYFIRKFSFMLLCLMTTFSICFGDVTRCSYIKNTLSCAELNLEVVPSGIPTWYKVLYLNSNKIKEITSETFRGLSLLEEIDLSNNEISKIADDAFSGLPKLRILTLANNNLESFPMFPPNSSLTQLVLSHNAIGSLSMTSLAHLPHLQHLDVRLNQLSDLQLQLPPMPQLTELFLSNNRISGIGNATFVHVPALESLRLAKNQIASLHKTTLDPLVNLRHLELNKNRLTQIEGLTFEHLDKLQTLKLRRNNLTHLMDGCFYGLNNIQELELDSNNLSEVKSWLYGLEALTSLSLTYNHIDTIEDAWKFTPHLQHLDVSDNALSHMSAASFGALDRLETLALNGNRIAHIAEGTFDDMAALTTLELDDNEISWSIEDRDGVFAGLSSLATLRIENNRIQAVTGGAFEGLGELRALYMGGNNVSTVQEGAFDHLAQLEQLHMESPALLCDCGLAWLPVWLQEGGFSDTVTGTCSHPELVRGQTLSAHLTFQCLEEEYLKPLMVVEPESLIVLKGQTVTLSCEAASSVQSALTIHWRKDNFPIHHLQMNSSASMLDEVVYMKSLLEIRNAQDEDTGSYQCMAVNEVAKTYSGRARINVHVFPTFTKRPVDVTIRASSSAKLECAASGQPDPEISWQKDGGEDFPAARERRMQVMPGDVFMISHAKLEDQGVYTCTATNAAGTIMTNATLTVLEPPKFAEPMLNQRVTAGDTAVLECMAQGSPQPTITWLKDDDALVLTERHFFTAENQLLVIVEAKANDAGTYTCQMKNSLGMDVASMELQVAVPAGPRAVGIFSDDRTTTGIIIIAVVCCVVGTSLIWVVIIYQTRRKHEEYSSTPTEETTVPEMAYTTVGEDGKTRAHYAPKVQNGGPHLANGSARAGRHIVLESGMHVQYDSGVLQITPNPLCVGDQYAWDMAPGRGEFQHSPGAGPLVTTAQHHGSGSMESVSHTTSGGEETTTSSTCQSTSSPGNHSTGLLSTFHPLLPASPHNTSSQPLLAEENYRSSQGEHNYPYQHSRRSSHTAGNRPHSHRPLSYGNSSHLQGHVPYSQGHSPNTQGHNPHVEGDHNQSSLRHSQSGGNYPAHRQPHSDNAPAHALRHSQSEHGYDAPPRPPRHKPAAAVPHSQSYHHQPQQDSYATFPRPHQQPHVHKASSCSHIQSQGTPRQSLSALPEDGSPASHTPHTASTQRSRSNLLSPSTALPPQPPQRRQSLEAVNSQSDAHASLQGLAEVPLGVRVLNDVDAAKSIAQQCNEVQPGTDSLRLNLSATGLVQAQTDGLHFKSSADGMNCDKDSGVGVSPPPETVIGQKPLTNGHAAFVSHDAHQPHVVSL